MRNLHSLITFEAMSIKLNRPLAFFDLETTGVNVGTDRIVEYSILKIMPDGKREVRTQRVNPGIPIPPHTTEIHGISDEDIKDEPKFEDLAPNLYIFLHDCDLGGYNSNKFDIPLLVEEFGRCGYEFDISERKLIDVQNIFHKMEQRTLAAAYQFYCDKSLENAHSAEADNLATFEILEAQLEKYDKLEPNVDFLHEFSKRGNHVDLAGRFAKNQNGDVVINFGKHKGKTVESILEQEPSYYSWMMRGDFASDTKKVFTKIKQEFDQKRLAKKK